MAFRSSFRPRPVVHETTRITSSEVAHPVRPAADTEAREGTVRSASAVPPRKARNGEVQLQV